MIFKAKSAPPGFFATQHEPLKRFSRRGGLVTEASRHADFLYYARIFSGNAGESISSLDQAIWKKEMHDAEETLEEALKTAQAAYEATDPMEANRYAISANFQITAALLNEVVLLRKEIQTAISARAPSSDSE